jgi:hypothetical protein
MESKTNRRKIMTTPIVGLSSNLLSLSAFITSYLVLMHSNKNNPNLNIKNNFKLNHHYDNQKTYNTNNGNNKVTKSYLKCSTDKLSFYL